MDLCMFEGNWCAEHEAPAPALSASHGRHGSDGQDSTSLSPPSAPSETAFRPCRHCTQGLYLEDTDEHFQKLCDAPQDFTCMKISCYLPPTFDAFTSDKPPSSHRRSTRRRCTLRHAPLPVSFTSPHRGCTSRVPFVISAVMYTSSSSWSID